MNPEILVTLPAKAIAQRIHKGVLNASFVEQCLGEEGMESKLEAVNEHLAVLEAQEEVYGNAG